MVVLVLLAAGCAQAQAGNGFVFEPLVSGKALPGTQPDNHASTLVELKNGDVLVAWFGGTKEGAPDVAIYAATLHGGVWSAQREVARTKDVACWNPVLFHDARGVLWLYYKTGKKPATWTGLRKHSEDEGQTWSAAEPLPEGVLGPIKDKPLVLSDGAIVSGSSVEANSASENLKWTAWIERSVDNGKSWTKAGPITVPVSADVPDAGALAAAREGKHADRDEAAKVTTKVTPPADHLVGLIQPAVVAMGGHHLRFYARSRGRAQRIAIADSLDDGRSWSEARYIDLPNPNSGIDAVGLKDGRVVVVFNNSYNRRTPLNLAVSKDGEHFTVFKKLDEGPGQYSYPAIVQAANGDLLVCYSWRRQTIKFARVPKTEIP